MPNPPDDGETGGDGPEYLAGFAARLAEARNKRGWTQGDLAAESGVSQSYISQLEKAKWEPKITTVLLLATALGVHPDKLLPSDIQLPDDG